MEVHLNSVIRFEQASNHSPNSIENFIKNNPKLTQICIIALAILGLVLIAAAIWLTVPGLTYAWTSTGWTWVVPLNSLPISTMIASVLLGIAGGASIAGFFYLSMKKGTIDYNS